MRTESGTVSLGATAKKLDVDNRITLRIYYRIANNLIKQAAIYRLENNFVDQHVMLMRFSRNIATASRLPGLNAYRAEFEKKLLNVLTELEALKPNVRRKLEELNNKMISKVDSWIQYQDTLVNYSTEWVAINNQTPGFARSSFPSVPLVQNDKLSQSKLVDRKL